MVEQQKRLNIAFFSAFDLEKLRGQSSWYATFRHMILALQKYCGEVSYLGPVVCEEQTIARKIQARTRAVLAKNYVHHQCIIVSKKYGKVGAQRLREKAFDVVVAPIGAPEIAYLETDVPIVLVTDATLGQLTDYYDTLSNLSQRSLYEVNTIEYLALKRSSAVVFSSEWAAQYAIERYQTDKRKVHVIPFGANLDHPPSREAVLRRKRSDRCTLLFVGIDWHRKGGDIALDTFFALEKMGLQAELTIVCGCVPVDTPSHERIHIIPFLDKNDEQQRSQLEHLYLSADFLLLPTRSDCTPIVFCEANAFGLPVITTATGGIPYIISQEENGFMLPLDSTGQAYAESIAKLYANEEYYINLSRSSRMMFEKRLNWDHWGVKLGEILSSITT